MEGSEIAGDERSAEKAGETLVLMQANLGLALLLLGIEAMCADDGAERRARDRLPRLAAPAVARNGQEPEEGGALPPLESPDE